MSKGDSQPLTLEKKIKIGLFILSSLAVVAAGGWWILEDQAEKERVRNRARRATAQLIDWRLVSGGSFTMGSNEEGPEDARPAHRVRLPSFELSRSEVTVRQYERCVKVGVCRRPGVGEQCNWERPDRKEHPVNCLSWGEARTFARWLDADLPTEAEWEFAARGRGEHLHSPWGDERVSCRRVVMSEDGHGCGGGGSMEVCSKQRGNSPEGICDLIGNVSEWVRDDYHESYEGAPRDGSARCAEADCAPGRRDRISRGGSWHDDERADLSALYRSKDPNYGRYFYLGFRLRRDVP